VTKNMLRIIIVQIYLVIFDECNLLLYDWNSFNDSPLRAHGAL
jgi:hypothetical protein